MPPFVHSREWLENHAIIAILVVLSNPISIQLKLFAPMAFNSNRQTKDYPIYLMMK